MASKEGVKSPWKMTKQELLSGGSTAGLPGASQLDRGRGAPGRDRQDAATHGHRQHAKKGLTQMTHAQLMDTAREMGLTLPVKPTKAQMIRAIRDSAGSPADTVVILRPLSRAGSSARCRNPTYDGASRRRR